MSRSSKINLRDDYVWLSRGMIESMRDAEFYRFLRDVFAQMDIYTRELVPGKPTANYFMNHAFKTKMVGENWEKIVAMHEAGYAPLRVQRGDSDDNHSVAEYNAACAAIDVMFPPPTQRDETGSFRALALHFGHNPISLSKETQAEVVAALEITCRTFVNFLTPGDEELARTNKRAALDAKLARTNTIIKMFNNFSGRTRFVDADDGKLLQEMFAADTVLPHPLFAGDTTSSANDFDKMLDGLPPVGLTILLSPTGGGKTTWMTSFLANQLLFSDKAEMAWCYVLEDGAAETTKRIMLNMLNTLGDISMTKRDFLLALPKDSKLQELVRTTARALNGRVKVFSLQKTTAEKSVSYDTVQFLTDLDTDYAAADIKPTFLVIDYLQLLQLARGGHTRAEDLSIIAGLLDAWGERNKVCVISACQITSGATDKAIQEGKLPEISDLHDCKSISHACRMILSAVTVPGGKMLMRVLKNRNGPNRGVFVGNCDMSRNITLRNVRAVAEADLASYQTGAVAAPAAPKAGGRGGQRGGSFTKTAYIEPGRQKNDVGDI